MRRYLHFVIPAGLAIIVLVVLLVNLSSSLVYFVTPTELVESEVVEGSRSRLGGQVERGSITLTAEAVSFRVTDGRQTVAVVHEGAPQQLFQEGIGVVVEGLWDGIVFWSDTMLVRHDEQYRTDGGVYEEGDPTSVTP